MNKRPFSQKNGSDQKGFDTWLADLEDQGEERGYFEPVGADHSVVLTDKNPTLLITFERSKDIRSNDHNGIPLGWQLTEDNDWSNLCLIAHGDTWFRDKSVYGFFDRLIDDGFFEDFDQVIFYGAGMCGYAAAAFSVASPQATVIAVQPQASLDPDVADWDRRFPRMRRTSFSDRFGYAPDMAEAAEGVFLVYDPLNPHDNMHASLFDHDNVTRIRGRRLGARIGQALEHMQILPDLLNAAVEGKLDETRFYQAMRTRRRYAPYLRTLLNRFETKRQPMRVRMLCNSVTTRLKAPRFTLALAHAEQELRESVSAHESAG